jgi:DNA polymerase-4
MYNQAEPSVMHIDLNSCFATIEQQARPLLRGRPVAIVNRRSNHTSIVTASYEAKVLGVTTGMKLNEALKICPDIVALESDPPKYRYIYRQLMRIMNDYSAHVRMKSIDEGVIDFSEATIDVRQRNLCDIGWEIKNRLWGEIGGAINCNVGISTNRFLAKTAAGLNKPNGLDVITHKNLRSTFKSLELTDITGIAQRMELRLNQVGIYTALEFLDANEEILRKQVFKSITGSQWYKRLRGWEVDKHDYDIKTVGRQYVLDEYKLSRDKVLQRLHFLCEEVGQKIRSQGLVARGVRVYARGYQYKGSGWNGEYWQARHLLKTSFSSDKDIYSIARQLFEDAPNFVKEIGVSCYQLDSSENIQLAFFDDRLGPGFNITSTIDSINLHYGGRTIHSADTLSSNSKITRRIPFGGTRYL